MTIFSTPEGLVNPLGTNQLNYYRGIRKKDGEWIHVSSNHELLPMYNSGQATKK